MRNTYPGTDKDTDPWLYRLSQNRTTVVRFKSDPIKEVVIEDNWAHATGATELPEQWTGETIFEYLPPQDKPP